MINMFCAGAMFWMACTEAIDGNWPLMAMALVSMALNLWVGVRA